MTLNSSRSPRTFSEARSMRVVRVENPPRIVGISAHKDRDCGKPAVARNPRAAWCSGKVEGVQRFELLIKAYRSISRQHIPGCLEAQSGFRWSHRRARRATSSRNECQPQHREAPAKDCRRQGPARYCERARCGRLRTSEICLSSAKTVTAGSVVARWQALVRMERINDDAGSGSGTQNGEKKYPPRPWHRARSKLRRHGVACG